MGLRNCGQGSRPRLRPAFGNRKVPSIRRAIEIARKMDVMEDLVVQLVLQDHVRREKLNFTATLSALAIFL